MEPETTSHSVPKSFGFSIIILLPLSIIATIGGCMSARGNGLPNALYFLPAVILLPLINKTLIRPRRFRWLLQLVVIGVGGFAAFGVAYYSSRVSPKRMFSDLFDQPPLASVSEMEARKQYFDGFIWLLTFKISDDDFGRLENHSNLRLELTDRDTASLWRSYVTQWASIAQFNWPKEAPSPRLDFYLNLKPRGVTKLAQAAVIRDPASGRVWVVLLRD